MALRPGAKQYSPPRVTTKGGICCNRGRICRGGGGNGEAAGAVIRPDERILLGRSADEDAVVQPLGLDELELPLEVRSGEDEDDAPFGAVVFENSLGQRWAVARPAPDHPVEADVDTTLCVKGVPRVGTSGMRTGRTLEAAEVVGVEEVVVAAPVCRHFGVQLPEHDVGAVSTEHVRTGHRRQLARLVGVAEDDLTGLDRLLFRVRGRHAAAFDRRLADPVLEAEGGAPGGELVTVLSPDDLHA